jgi:hypothetical protein
VLSLNDAWLTSNPVFGVGRLSGAWASAVPLFFVLAGDFRYLLLVAAAGPDGRLHPRPFRLAAAAGLTLIVPLGSQVVLAALPPSGPRLLYWVYEVGFVALTLALLRWHPGLRGNTWLRSLSRFVLLYYGLWAAADSVLLLWGWDWAYGLRVIPNLLYYGGFIAATAQLAPRPGS